MAWTRERKLIVALAALLSSSVFAESQVEYAEKSVERWKNNENAMDKKYSQLLKQAEQEPGQSGEEALKNLKEAKKHWEDFRRSFCLSMSETYGGEWESTNESDCRNQLAQSFTADMSKYGW